VVCRLDGQTGPGLLCFEADPAVVADRRKEAYSIVIPPPNVTGILHLGHVLNNALQDILARRARQEGKEVLWLPGTDHAGIATQAKVERELREKEGKPAATSAATSSSSASGISRTTRRHHHPSSSSASAARAIGAASASPWTRPTRSG
jgi:hypothetical protein